MKIIYKPYMIRRLRQAVHQAHLADKEIEKIKLTLEEYEQLKWEVEKDQPSYVMRHWDRRDFPPSHNLPTFMEFMGIKVEKE